MAATTYRRVPDLGSSDLRSEKDVSDGSDSANDVGEFQPRLEGFHKPRESLLTNSAGWITKRGFINFFIILVTLSNCRELRDNFLTHGILVDPRKWVRYILEPGLWPPIFVLLGINIFIPFSLMMEKLLSEGKLSERFGMRILAASLASMLVAPAGGIIMWRSNPVVASLVLCLVVMLFLKLVSYHMVNFWCRERKAGKGHHRRKSSAGKNGAFTQAINGVIQNGCLKPVVIYPDNLTLLDIYYFVFTPTLCYELNFPRSPKIRIAFLLRWAVDSVLFLALVLSLEQQLILPLVFNSPKPFHDMSVACMVDQLLQVVVANMLIWLAIFFWFFHTTLNMMAELLKFADRQFYGDWWNAQTVRYFWKKWNMPVHQWCVRHAYNPLICAGMSGRRAFTVVFLISAILHEYALSIPIKTFRLWAFTGMAIQVPASLLVDEYLRFRFPAFGGLVVWLAFITVLAMSNLPYYHDYYLFSYGPRMMP